jgi:hypothetical protein
VPASALLCRTALVAVSPQCDEAIQASHALACKSSPCSSLVYTVADVLRYLHVCGGQEDVSATVQAIGLPFPDLAGLGTPDC